MNTYKHETDFFKAYAATMLSKLFLDFEFRVEANRNPKLHKRMSCQRKWGYFYFFTFVHWGMWGIKNKF